jgi:hypothetical protein
MKLFYYLIIAVVSINCSGLDGELIHVESNSKAGFNYPYFLFIPDEIPIEKEQIIIIEPNNSGFASDNFEKHIEKAERIASMDFYIGNYLSQNLKYPLLVPVFPRPESNWKIYTHALDRDVILQKGNELERIDSQLIAMFEDARSRLFQMGFSTKDKFIITGFSASGSFANRFTLIHPEKVLISIAGGVNGLLMLPYKEINGKQMKYPIGISDYEELFEKKFDSIAFKKLPQFLFMGELDDNDAIPYDDGYDEPERKLIYDLLGEEMQPTRWNNSIKIYKSQNANAKIITYRGKGHEHPLEIKEDILDYVRGNL